MKKQLGIVMLATYGLVGTLGASDKTIWGEPMVVNSAQSPANKGEGSGSPLASRRSAKKREGMATQKPSCTGRSTSRRGSKKSSHDAVKKHKEPRSSASEHHDRKPAKSKGVDSVETMISTQAQLDALLAQGKPVFVKISIQGCPPCNAMKPIIAELATEMSEAVTFVNIDATHKNFLKVKAYPTFIGYKNGKEALKFVGENTVKQLREEISKKLLN